MNAALKAAPILQTKNVRLGIAPLDCILNFKVHDGRGSEAHAILLLGTQTISTWVTSELVDAPQIATVTLVTSGQYQLQITCPFTTTKSTNISVEIELLAKGGAKITSRTKNFSGQVPDSARVIADVFVP